MALIRMQTTWCIRRILPSEDKKWSSYRFSKHVRRFARRRDFRNTLCAGRPTDLFYSFSLCRGLIRRQWGLWNPTRNIYMSRGEHYCLFLDLLAAGSRCDKNRARAPFSRGDGGKGRKNDLCFVGNCWWIRKNKWPQEKCQELKRAH